MTNCLEIRSLGLFLVLLLASPVLSEEKQHSTEQVYQRAKQYLQTQDYVSAESELLSLLKRDPNAAEAHFLLGVLYAQKGEHAKAYNFFTRALKLQPNSIPVLNNLGVNALHRGDELEAERYFRNVLALEPNDVNSLYNLGLIELKRKKFTQAEQYLREASAQQPEDMAILQGLLAAELELGKSEGVDETIVRILKIAPSEPRFYFQLAELLANKGFYQAALVVLQRARSLWPDSADVAYNLALVYFLSGKPNVARELAEVALKKADRADLHNLLGDIYEKLNLHDKAVEAYQAAVRLDPENEDYYFDLGYEFLVHRSFDLAEKIFANAISRLPRALKLHLGLATAHFAQTQYEKAIAALKVATEVAPESEVGYFFLGQAFVLLSNQAHLFAGDWIVEKFKKYMQLKPADPFPCYLYAVALLKRTTNGSVNLVEATKLLKKAIELNPDFPEAHFELGKIYFDDKRYEQAISSYERAVNLKPAFVEAYYRLAQAYAKAGNEKKAQEASELALKRQKELEAEAIEREKEILRFIYTLK